MYTIGQIAKRFSISRSTLLYYDSIGLLIPSGRTESNYRLYSQSDFAKMEKIRIYRDAGICLQSIKQLLQQKECQFHTILKQRLANINKEISDLRNQQKVILNILKNQSAIRQTRILSKSIWVSLLIASGLDEAGMKKWHCEFERLSPEAHQDFLESLGIEAEEIKSIRDWSKNKE